MTQLLWLRRDLRTADHPALVAATAAAADQQDVVVAYVLDPVAWRNIGPGRQAWLAANLLALDDELDGGLTILAGRPAEVIGDLAGRLGAETVHVTREPSPYGVRRDQAVAAALAERGVSWQETGTPYAVGPGLVMNTSGKPYQVFTPFSRAWRDHGWPVPAPTPADLSISPAERDPDALERLRSAVESTDVQLPEPGQAAAMRTWQRFLDEALDGYDDGRDLADRSGTSRMSPYLRLGVVHPRTLLAELGQLSEETSSSSRERYITELAWREFYADVLWHHPGSVWQDLKPSLAGLQYDQPAELIEAWRQGRTGFPFIDAGLRELLATGWMHNRARMATASFLVKDLHVHWSVGARHFLDHLLDGDLASNNHGWQWVAGTGTDASPYIRVFNPVTQGRKADPDGSYVRRWVPELAHLSGAAVHEPWKQPDGYAHGYPEPLVDHAEERKETLRRFGVATGKQ